MSEKPVVRKTRIVRKKVLKVKPSEPELESEPVCVEGVCRIVVPEPEPEPEPESEHVELPELEEEVQEEGSPEAKPKRRQSRYRTKEETSAEYDMLIDFFDQKLLEEKDTSAKKSYRLLKKKIKDLKGESLKSVKKPKKDKEKSTNPSGLTKPVSVSDEMLNFLKMMKFVEPDATTASRVQVTRALCQYVRENDLQNPENKKEILPDALLTKLLKYDRESCGELTYCSIQSVVKGHFLKTPAN